MKYSALAAALSASLALSSSTPNLPPFFAIDAEYIPLPNGVMPFSQNWAPNGDLIVFGDFNNGQQYAVNPITKKSTCITCTHNDNPRINMTFTYVLPDYKRLFVSNALGSAVFILECPDGILKCNRHTWVPVDLSADAVPGQPSLGRRTYHLAPDGKHLAYSNTQPNGLIMLICELRRNATAYLGTNHRAVNPPGPSGPDDKNLQHWANSGALLEFKAWTEGGKNIIIVTEEEAGNPDMYKLELATGEITRITNDPDWDEDGSPSPDGSLVAVASWRTQNRVSVYGIFKPLLPFTALQSAAAAAIYYVSSRPGFACDLVMWLVSPTSDAAGRVGQPLAPYTGGDVFSKNNIAGEGIWSPDGTSVLIVEGKFSAPAAGSNGAVLEIGAAPNRLRIAKIARKATKGPRIVESVVGSWAPTPQGYKGNYNFPGTHVFPGAVSGKLTLDLAGNLGYGSTNVTYENFSQDGKTFLSGNDFVGGSPATSITRTSNVIATDKRGKVVGYQKGAVTYTIIQPPPPAGNPPMSFAGQVSASWDGKTLTGLPLVGACPNTMPKESPLSISTKSRRDSVEITVTANVYGDVRPVQGALVVLGSQKVKTDSDGIAVLKKCGGIVTATAGTFVTAKKTIS